MRESKVWRLVAAIYAYNSAVRLNSRNVEEMLEKLKQATFACNVKERRKAMKTVGPSETPTLPTG